MNKKYFLSIPTVSILALSSTTFAISKPEMAGTPVGAVRAQDKVVQKMETKLDMWTDQAQNWAEKWQDALKEGAQDRINQAKERICTATQSRVGARWQKYYEARMNRVENMERGVLALQERVEYFKQKGLDTSKLETDIATLQQLIGEYKTAYTEFLTALEEVKSIPCANYEGKFLPELRQARDAWSVVRAKSQSIKDFYLSDIKPDLAELRTQLKELNLES